MAVTGLLGTNFSKALHPKSDPMHVFVNQPKRRMGQNLASEAKFEEYPYDSAPKWNLLKLGPIVYSFGGNSRADWNQL